MSMYRQRLEQNGASDEVLDFFNSKNRDNKSFASGNNSIFKSIGYENGLRTSEEKNQVRQLQIQTLESMLQDQTLVGQEAKDTQRYVRQLKKQVNQPYNLAQANDISSEFSNEVQTQNLSIVPYEPVLEEKVSSYQEPTQNDTLSLPEVIYLPDTSNTQQVQEISQTQTVPYRQRKPTSIYSKATALASVLLIAGCTMLSSSRKANTMTVEQANKMHAQQVVQKEQTQAANRPKRFRGEEWKINELIANYQYADAARLTEEFGWHAKQTPTYNNRSEAWEAEKELGNILIKNKWHATEESFAEQNQKVSEIMHALAQYYVQIGIDESKISVVKQSKKVQSNEQTLVEPTPTLPKMNPPTITPNIPAADESELLAILIEEPKVIASYSLHDHLKVYERLADDSISASKPEEPKEEVNPKQMEVKAVLKQAEEFQQRNTIQRFPPFTTRSQALSMYEKANSQANHEFVRTSPFALANDQFALYVARRPNQEQLLQKRIDLVYQDGGMENVVKDLEGITQVLSNQDLKHSLQVAKKIEEVESLAKKGDVFGAYSLSRRISPDNFGISSKLSSILQEKSVYSTIERKYMDEAAHNFQWADWSAVLKNTKLAQEVRPSANLEMDKIELVADSMLKIKELTSQADYVSALNQYDEIISVMQDHPWNQNNRFTNLRQITQENASKEFKTKAKQSKGQERAYWLSQWQKVNPKAQKTLSFKWMARGLRSHLQEQESIAKN